MSVNLEVSIEKENGEETVLLLPGFSRGITHSAMVGVGDTIHFFVGTGRRLLLVKVNEIHHDWQPGGSSVSPCTTAYAEAARPISTEEMDALFLLGFREI